MAIKKISYIIKKVRGTNIEIGGEENFLYIYLASIRSNYKRNLKSN